MQAQEHVSLSFFVGFFCWCQNAVLIIDWIYMRALQKSFTKGLGFLRHRIVSKISLFQTFKNISPLPKHIFGPRSQIPVLKLVFLRNYWAIWNQISNECFWERGKLILFHSSWPHEEDGCHAHTCTRWKPL